MSFSGIPMNLEGSLFKISLYNPLSKYEKSDAERTKILVDKQSGIANTITLRKIGPLSNNESKLITKASYEVPDEIKDHFEKTVYITCNLIGIEYIPDPDKREAFLSNNLEMMKRFSDKYIEVEDELDKLKGGMRYQDPPPVIFYNSREKSKGKKLAGVVLGGIIGTAAITVNYFTGVISGLPKEFYNPEGHFDEDGVKNKNDPYPYDIDGDGDGLLDGHSVIVIENDEKFQQFLDAGILHRRNSNGNYVFFGEKSLGSDTVKASPRAIYQAKFLSELDDVEYQRAVKEGLIDDFDWDEDYMDNYFESHKTETDYLTPNNRYVIWLSTSNPENATSLLLGETPKEKAYIFLVDWQRIPEKNVKLFEYTDATRENLEDAIADVRAKADKNDFIYIFIDAESLKYRRNGVQLYDGFLNYEKLDEIVDTITDTKVLTIMISACYSYLAREPLKDEHVPRLVIPMYDLSDLLRRYLPDKRRIDEEEYNVPAEDNDGFISIGEAVRDKKIEYEEDSYYDILDTHGWAFKIFLGDYLIGEKDHTKYIPRSLD